MDFYRVGRSLLLHSLDRWSPFGVSPSVVRSHHDPTAASMVGVVACGLEHHTFETTSFIVLLFVRKSPQK